MTVIQANINETMSCDRRSHVLLVTNDFKGYVGLVFFIQWKYGQVNSI